MVGGNQPAVVFAYRDPLAQAREIPRRIFGSGTDHLACTEEQFYKGNIALRVGVQHDLFGYGKEARPFAQQRVFALGQQSGKRAVFADGNFRYRARIARIQLCLGNIAPFHANDARKGVLCLGKRRKLRFELHVLRGGFYLVLRLSARINDFVRYVFSVGAEGSAIISLVRQNAQYVGIAV